MEMWMSVDWIESIGWLASALTIVAYSVNTMVPLRILAIASSVSFGIYGLLVSSWPLVAMEACLLPINCYRLWQILTIRNRVQSVGDRDEGDFSIIKTYGKARRLSKGAQIFKQGDAVDQLFFIASGKVLIEEIDVVVEQGDIFGEIAFFTDAATRTASARCVEDALVYEMNRTQFMRLQFEDPSFGLSVMRTITRRLFENGSLVHQRNQTSVST